MDSHEFSELATKFEEAQAFRKATIDRIRRYLAVDFRTEDQDTSITQPASRWCILEQFAPVGHAMVAYCTFGNNLGYFSGQQLIP